MAVKFLDNTGLGYFWSKIKAWCNVTFAAIAHTHTSYAVKHSYTTAANAAKNWYRIANANTHQMDTSKPLHVQFLLTAWNPDQPADYYEQWFVNCEVFGRNSGLQVFGNSAAPFSQIRVLYENTVADIDTNDRPAIDIYLNYVLATACHVEIQEVYNSGWTFLTNGILAASTVPIGFENRAVGIQVSGIHQATNASYATYTSLQRSDITANITLANSDTYRMRVLNCTNAITVTVPSLDTPNAWFLIKNFNATSTTNNVTIHPSTTSVLIDDSNADIVLKPGEWVIIASKAANSYSLIGDSRWKSQKADKGTTLSDYGITDAKIANGTITLGSNSITPLTSVPSHNQASNTITAMTGYSKPSSTSAIAASDTLNQAIGKLEKAIDDADISNVVHKTGDEDIQGFKTFKPSLVGSDSSVSYVSIRNPSYDRAVTDSGTHWTGIKFGDASGNLYDTYEGCNGLIEHAVNAETKHTFTQIACYKSVDTSGDNNYFRVGFTAAGLPYILFNCDIINDIFLRNSHEPSINFYADHYKKGDSLSAETQIAALYFHDNANPAAASDRLGGLLCRVTADKTTYVRMVAYKDEADTAYVRGLSINYTADDIAYGACPTHPDMSKNDETIATAYWVRHATGNTSLNAATASDLASGSVLAIGKGGTGSSTKNFVDLSNNQSVSGIKTFNRPFSSMAASTCGSGTVI